MSEKNDNLPEEPVSGEGKPGTAEFQADFAKRMQAIASDLWGSLGGSREGLNGIRKTPQAGTGAAGKEPAQAGAAPETLGREDGKIPTPQPEKKKDIRRLWQTADETIDWTDALGHDRPTDGLTGVRLWELYHRLAPKVLEGDLDAYVEVLTTTNPLGDLTDYVNGMVIRTPSADRLECRFECRRELLEAEGTLYSGALALRIARDLLATLPVSEVYVEGNLDGIRKLGVTFLRQQLLKRNPVFLDPVSFAKECGGILEE